MSVLTGKRLRIISDGTAASTHILDANGDLVKFGLAALTKIEFLPIEPKGFVTAILTISSIALDLDAVVVDAKS